MELKEMTPQEQKYSYPQTTQIAGQTGCIGYLRGNMNKEDNVFSADWTDCRSYLKTGEFNQEINDVVIRLRFDEEYGGILKNMNSLKNYCKTHSDSTFGRDGREHGFRVNTELYSYMLRITPGGNEYGVHVTCYVRDWLDNHMSRAEKGIRFITPDYKDKFRIPDGGKIRVTTLWGEKTEYVCRYIDDVHLEVGNNLYHICEYAEMLGSNGAVAEPVTSKQVIHRAYER